MLAKYRILIQNFSKALNFLTLPNVPVGKLQEKNIEKIFFFAFLKSLKKVVGSGSGSISQRCGSGSRIRTKISRIPNHAFKMDKTFKEIKKLKKDVNGIVNVSCMKYNANQIKGRLNKKINFIPCRRLNSRCSPGRPRPACK
jgi:hypothetical protein